MALNPKHFSAKDRFASMFKRFVPDGSSDPDGVMEEEPKYRGDDFLVPAADANGRSGRLQCRVPPLICREVQEIIHQRRFPFRTDSDVVRWCVMYGLSALSEMEVSPGFLSRAIAEIEILKKSEILRAQQEVVRMLEANVKWLVDSNRWHEAKISVLDAMARFKASEDDVYRDMILEQIRSKFKHVMEWQGKRRGDEE